MQDTVNTNTSVFDIDGNSTSMPLTQGNGTIMTLPKNVDSRGSSLHEMGAILAALFVGTIMVTVV